jgi:sirohydrochlorin cobaltochelatase
LMDTPAAPVSAEAAQKELAQLDARINAILPPRYVGCFEAVPPNSMGSAKLAYEQDGRVAWGEIWTTFCHLALAGGPPHRGRLLPAVPTSEALSFPAEQAAVVAEIKRAIRLTSDLPPAEEQPPGWVVIRCYDEDMAAWLVRAIVAENVTARHAGPLLYVPAGPHFRIEKEIKNVVVCVAKTCHYLLEHVDPNARPRGFGHDLIEPALPDDVAAAPEEYRLAAERLRERLSLCTGLKAIVADSVGWIGLECASEEMVIWMQRAVIVENVLARREADILFVPVCMGNESSMIQERLEYAIRRVHRLWLLYAAITLAGSKD